MQVEDVLNTAVTGNIDQHVRNGNQQEIRRYGNRIRYGAVERIQNAFDVGSSELVVQKIYVLFEAEKSPDIELRHISPEHVGIADVALTTYKVRRFPTG